jgi:hypothetical protein
MTSSLFFYLLKDPSAFGQTIQDGLEAIQFFGFIEQGVFFLNEDVPKGLRAADFPRIGIVSKL